MTFFGKLRRVLLELLFLIGLGLICWGIWQISKPFGIVAAGVCLAALVVLDIAGDDEGESVT